MRQVELLGKKYTAERFTRQALLGVVSKFVKGATSEAEMIEALTDRDAIDRMAYWISFIFPEMAADGIVWYGLQPHPKSGIDLELEDLLALVTKLVEWAGESVSPPHTPVAAPHPEMAAQDDSISQNGSPRTKPMKTPRCRHFLTPYILPKPLSM